MKHFVITTKIGHTEFTYSCGTAYEALNAIVDIYEANSHPLPLSLDRDELMEMLLEMKKGKLLTRQTVLYTVTYESAKEEGKQHG